MSFPASLISRRAFAVLALTSVVALGACGDDGGPKGDSYRLFSVNSQPLPIVQTNEFGTFSLKSGVLSLNSGGKYTVRVNTSLKPAGGAVQNSVNGENGTYVISGSTITLTPTHDFEDGVLTPSPDADPVSGTKTASSVTLNTPDFSGGFVTIVFQK